MNVIWRFYMDQQGQWRWQQMNIDRAVLCESMSGYATYDACMGDASARGYTYQASQAGTIAPRNRYVDRR
jgi:hypothetical protein